MNKYAIIGFGSAGFNALRAIREVDPTSAVDIYSEHHYPPYNPMLTTYYIKGAIPYEAMFPFGDLESISREYNCTVYTDTEVSRVDASAKSITTSSGDFRQYDKILICSGASPVMLPVGDIPEERIYAMRTVDDAKRLKDAFDSGSIRRILVIGASWVGIKVVEAAWARGIDSVLSDLAPHIFMASAFEGASEKCEEYLETENIELHFGVTADKCWVEDDKCIIKFSDGTETVVDAVVMCVGIRPCISFIDPEQIKVGRAIIVDNSMGTSAEGIYAAGDVCEGIDIMTGETRNIGLWANSAVQGRCAGLSMAGEEASLEGNILHNITHFLNSNFISFGDKSLPGERKVLLDDGMKYIEVLVDDGKLYCINMLCDYEISGVIKNCIMKYFSKDMEPLEELETAVLAKSGLPNELIRILSGMVVEASDRDNIGH